MEMNDTVIYEIVAKWRRGGYIGDCPLPVRVMEAWITNQLSVMNNMRQMIDDCEITSQSKEIQSELHTCYVNAGGDDIGVCFNEMDCNWEARNLDKQKVEFRSGELVGVQENNGVGGL